MAVLRLVFSISLLAVLASALPLTRRMVGLRAPPLPPGAKVADPQWFEQKLDHFSSNTRTWYQRFFFNDSLWDRRSGPVFLMLGGEGSANPAWLATDTDIMRNAAKFHALVLLLEHRLAWSWRLSLLSISHLQVLWRESPHSKCISGQPGLPLQPTSSQRCSFFQAVHCHQVFSHGEESVDLVWRVIFRGSLWLAEDVLP